MRETNCAIHWIDFYPGDSSIQRLNNRGLGITAVQGKLKTMLMQKFEGQTRYIMGNVQMVNFSLAIDLFSLYVCFLNRGPRGTWPFVFS